MAVVSLPLRENMRTSSPFKCTWIRSPSYLVSIVYSLSAKSLFICSYVLREASIGRIGCSSFYIERAPFSLFLSSFSNLSNKGFSIAARKSFEALKMAVEFLLKFLKIVSCLMLSLISLRISLQMYFISKAVTSEQSLAKTSFLLSEASAMWSS